jgi:hypothetical protein
MTSSDGTTSSQQLVLTLAAGERKLERLEATTEVKAKLSTTREALADVLIYESALDRYTLRGLKGRALVLREAGEKPGTCSIMTGATGYFTHSAQAPNFPTAENPGGGDKVDKTGADCTGELKR